MIHHPSSRNSECEFVYTNMRPTYRKTFKGDCTTRAMAWCLKGELTYDQIEAKQYAYARKTGNRRNAAGTWNVVIARRGWEAIIVKRTKRSVIASVLKDTLSSPVITASSGHVAVVDVGGIVRDTWDSRGGRVERIYAPGDSAWKIACRLLESGIGAFVLGSCLTPPQKRAV